MRLRSISGESQRRIAAPRPWAGDEVYLLKSARPTSHIYIDSSLFPFYFVRGGGFCASIAFSDRSCEFSSTTEVVSVGELYDT